MPNAAIYYEDELINWNASLDYYAKESIELEGKLMAVIQQNTIPNRALTAEHFLNRFSSLRFEMNSLTGEMSRQQNNLRKGDTTIDDSAITAQITANQNALREKMKTMEKNFIDVKYNCSNFLSGNYTH